MVLPISNIIFFHHQTIICARRSLLRESCSFKQSSDRYLFALQTKLEVSEIEQVSKTAQPEVIKVLSSQLRVRHFNHCDPRYQTGHM